MAVLIICAYIQIRRIRAAVRRNGKSKAHVVQGYSYMQTIFLTPLMFGVAHVHHLVELVSFQRVQLTSAVAMVSLWYLTLYILMSGLPESASYSHVSVVKDLDRFYI